MPFSTTNKAAYQQLTTSTWPEQINDEVTRITIDCDECSTYWQNKKQSKNTATIICDILNHSEENFVIEIKPISWSCPVPIFFQKWISKSNPDPKKSQVSCKMSNPDPVHAHLCCLGLPGL